MNQNDNSTVLSRRDYFAMAALQGLVGTLDYSYLDIHDSGECKRSINRNLVRASIQLADEMIYQLALSESLIKQQNLSEKP